LFRQRGNEALLSEDQFGITAWGGMFNLAAA
jgi:hypothetical protein